MVTTRFSSSVFSYNAGRSTTLTLRHYRALLPSAAIYSILIDLRILPIHFTSPPQPPRINLKSPGRIRSRQRQRRREEEEILSLFLCINSKWLQFIAGLFLLRQTVTVPNSQSFYLGCFPERHLTHLARKRGPRRKSQRIHNSQSWIITATCALNLTFQFSLPLQGCFWTNWWADPKLCRTLWLILSC